MGEVTESLKDRIVDQAMDLFRRRGYKSVTVDEIIEAAGTSKGGFYYYFKSKEELLLYWLPLVEEVYEKWYEQADKDKSSQELLTKFMRVVFRTTECDNTPELLTVIYSAQLNLKGKRKIYDNQRKLYEILYDIIKRGQQKGELSERYSYKEMARMIVTVMRGAMYEWCLTDGMNSLEEYGSRIEEYLLRSFKKE